MNEAVQFKSALSAYLEADDRLRDAFAQNLTFDELKLAFAASESARAEYERACVARGWTPPWRPRTAEELKGLGTAPEDVEDRTSDSAD